MNPPRIASLVPSLTELLLDLGLGPCLVARTGFCVHPAQAVAGVPKVGGTKDVQIERLRALAPTHVLVNVDENRLDTVETLRSFVPHVLVTHPLGPEDNLALYAQLADCFGDQPGVRARAAALTATLQLELALTVPGAWAPETVWVPIWRAPWMTVARNTYIARSLARLNWHTLPEVQGATAGADRYPTLGGDEPWLAGVQRVLLPSEPYRFDERHLDEVRQLCPQARVDLVAGEWLSWYGSRAPTALQRLRALRNAPHAEGTVTIAPWTCSSR